MKQLTLWGSGPVGQVRWTADEQYLLAASTLGIIQYDASNMSALKFIPRPAYDTLFSGDGSMMAILRDSTTMEIRKVLEDTVIASLTLPENSGTITSTTFSQDGKLLAIGSSDGQIFIWQITDGKLIQKLKSPQINITSLAFSQDTTKLASGAGYEGSDFPIHLWDIKQGLLGTIQKNKKVTHLEYSPDGSRLVSTTRDGYLYLWDVTSEPRQLTEFDPKDYPRRLYGSVVFSPDGVYYAYSVDNSVFLAQSEDGFIVWENKNAHTNHINSLAFSPIGRKLASGGDDCAVRIWGIPDGALQQTIGGNSEYISAMAFSKDGSKFASASGESAIHFWRVQDGSNLRAVSLPAVATSLVFDMTGDVLVCGLVDGSILEVDVNLGTTKYYSTAEHHASVVMLEFSPDGTQLVSGDLNGIIRLWNYQGGGSILNTIDVGPADVFSIAPDFSAIAANKYKRLHLWRLDNGETVYSMKGQSTGVISLAYSPDGQTILSGSVNQSIQKSYAEDGAAKDTFTGTTTPHRIFFTPDGTLSASAGNRSIDLWESSGNTLLRTISMPEGDSKLMDFPMAVIFSPDGAYLVFGMPDGTIQFWGVL